METDSSDSNGESVKSIPRPDFEALSAIDSPQPQLASLLDGNNDMETGDTTSMPSKRQKYVVSAPPGSANGSSNSSNSSPSNANVGSSLTMKLTKVQPHQQQIPRTSTPNTKPNKVPKEMVALQRSHNESEVLTNFVNEVSKLKRRKSRYVADPLDTPAERVELSRSLHSEAKREKKSHKANLKRSKSIPAPNWDSDDDWLDDDKSRRVRGRSVNCDELHVEDSNSNSNPPPMSRVLDRTRSRSKTLSLSHEDRLPRRSNLRSENEEFAKKHNAFLDSVINDGPETELNAAVSVDVEADWSASDLATHNSTFSENPTEVAEKEEEEEEKDADLRLRFIWQPPPMEGWDPFCWKCRECGQLMPCSKCLRSFHTYCVRPATTKFDSSWKCPECQSVEAAPKRLRRNDVSVDLLGQLLFFALERMKHVRGANKLLSPQDVFPLTYKKYFVNPVSFVSLAECIRRGLFQSTEEFLSEVKWIQHNALIMDAGDAKVEQASKAVVKVCRQEANEIDTCPECYLNANSSDEWFVKVCRHPHLLLWAKLKGFPYWPAKAMGVSNSTLVNVRFFGKHDRAFVPIKDCFLYSAQNPNTQTSRRSARDLAECIREVEIHIENIKEKIGAFCYAEYRTAYDPLEEQQQLEQMMPGVYEAIDRELEPANKTPLQFLIRKTADDKLSMVKKTKATESGNESDQSGSPVKKPPEATEAVTSSGASEPHPKLNKSSNYEVISRSGESLSDSRCKVLLKRKSMAAKTTSSSVEAPSPAPAQETPAPAAPVKRKHSLSDASCTSESSDHKRKAKHAKKQHEQEQPVEAEPREVAKKPCKSPEEPRVEKSSEKQTPKAPEGSPASVVSVVELVRRRQGVTITKIPRDQQQAVAAAPEAPTVAAPPPPAAALLSTPSQEAKPKAPERSQSQKSEVELQQQQLIKKVIPFVEIKTEVMSEEEEEATEQLPVPEPEQPAQPEPAPVPAAPPPDPVKSPLPENIKIKEEVLSEDEMETDQQQQQQQAGVGQRLETFPPMPQPMPPPPPPPLPPRAHVETAREETATPEAAVRFVGDTTIQKVSQKQGGKSMDSTAKRRGPQASSPALSPVPSPVLSAPATESLSPKSSGTYGVSKPTPAPSPQGQSKGKASQAQAQAPQQQQYRQKSDRAIPSTISSPGATAATTTTTTSSLLRSNMVVIPVEQANNCNPHSPMTIPVPPLRAVSKSTLQSTAASVSVPSQPPVAISVPPLAGLSYSPMPSTSAAPQGNGSGGGETAGGLLASALNGRTSHEPSLVTESNPNDPITPGMATAFSEMLLRSGPPKLVARPSGPLQSDGSHIYPSQAGPVSQKLKENAHKITDYFISVIEDTLSDMATGDQSVSEARIACLSLENERLKQHYDRQLTDLQRTSELMLAEMRNTLEQEHRRVISELRQQANIERMRAVDEAKKKQWCANCMREGQLYCCWNTSYCDYPCQQMHWPRHSSTCGQVVNSQLPVSPATTAATVMENVRSPKSKSATMTPTPAPSGNAGPTSSVRTTTAVCPPPAGPVTTGSVGKKWPPMMTPMMNQQPPPNPEATLLKLPSSTYLRPVVSTMPTTVTATPTVNNSINPMLPSSSGNHMAHLMPGPIQHQNNTANFNPKPVAQPIPVQRYNIPLPITINPSGAPYGLIAEQHQKQQPAPKAKARRSNNTTIRQVNSTNSQASMRSNQMNQVFPP